MTVNLTNSIKTDQGFCDGNLGSILICVLRVKYARDIQELVSQKVKY